MTKHSIEQLVEYYRQLLTPVYADRKFMHVGEVDVGLLHEVEQMRVLGASEPFLLAGNRGTSDQSIDDNLRLYLLNLTGNDMVDSARNFADTATNLPVEIQTAIDEWDPDQEARYVFAAQLIEISEIGNRQKYGRRKSTWLLLENKTTIDELWDQIGIARAPSKVVELTDKALKSYASELDQGDGTVWVPDNQTSVHGGSVSLRWVHTGENPDAVIRELKQAASKVRIMPFLEGVPMSIHGIVFPSGVVVLRPVELAVLRQRKRHGFLWGGCMTGYDPSSEDRAYMRDVARRTGEYLSAEIGYRGPFSIDGILTSDGFRPNELNPRLSGGFAPQLRGLADLPFAPLCWAVMENESLDYRAEELEEAIVSMADKIRGGRGMVITPFRIEQQRKIELVREGEAFVMSGEGQQADVVLDVGPSPSGGIIFMRPSAETELKGFRLAPELVRALCFCDQHLGTDFGELEAAKEVRDT